MIYIKEKKQNNDDSKLTVKTHKNHLGILFALAI